MDVNDIRKIFPEPTKARTQQYRVAKKSREKKVISESKRLSVIEYYRKVRNMLKVAKKFNLSTITVQEIISEA